jgi:hypothetical protein
LDICSIFNESRLNIPRGHDKILFILLHLPALRLIKGAENELRVYSAVTRQLTFSPRSR